MSKEDFHFLSILRLILKGKMGHSVNLLPQAFRTIPDRFLSLDFINMIVRRDWGVAINNFGFQPFSEYPNMYLRDFLSSRQSRQHKIKERICFLHEMKLYLLSSCIPTSPSVCFTPSHIWTQKDCFQVQNCHF